MFRMLRIAYAFQGLGCLSRCFSYSSETVDTEACSEFLFSWGWKARKQLTIVWTQGNCMEKAETHCTECNMLYPLMYFNKLLILFKSS